MMEQVQGQARWSGPSGGTQHTQDGQAGLWEMETGTAAALPGREQQRQGAGMGTWAMGRVGEAPGGQAGPLGLGSLRTLAVA